MQITKQKIEEMVDTYLSKKAEYLGINRDDKEFGFFSYTDNKLIFMPQQFFIDYIGEEERIKNIPEKQLEQTIINFKKK